jgi:DNA polymerase III delta subunit
MGGFAICQQLRIWPREIQEPFIKTAERLGEAGAAQALDLLAEIDHQSKTGVGDAASNVERFILQMGAGAIAKV